MQTGSVPIELSGILDITTDTPPSAKANPAASVPTDSDAQAFITRWRKSGGADQADRIRDIAERLDAHRKRQQSLHPKLTLTDCYNVLEKLRAGETLTAKDRTIHE